MSRSIPHQSVRRSRLPLAAILALGLLLALLTACTSSDEDPRPSENATSTTTPTATATPTATETATITPTPRAVHPEAFVEIADTRYAVVEDCQRSPTVGLVAIDLLLEDGDGNRAVFTYAIEESSPDVQVFPGYALQHARDGAVLEGTAASYDHSSRQGWVITEGTLDATAEAVSAEFPYSNTPCTTVAHFSDADSEDPFAGVLRYGVFDACSTDDGSYDLWLSEGARLTLRADGETFEATLRTPGGIAQSVFADDVQLDLFDGPVVAVTARIYDDGEPSAPPQRIEVEFPVDEPCS